jgi:hypothetical protein
VAGFGLADITSFGLTRMRFGSEAIGHIVAMGMFGSADIGIEKNSPLQPNLRPNLSHVHVNYRELLQLSSALVRPSTKVFVMDTGSAVGGMTSSL